MPRVFRKRTFQKIVPVRPELTLLIIFVWGMQLADVTHPLIICLHSVCYEALLDLRFA
ncbi:hypothetical protein GCM10009575_087940 [Streptomyces rhizosphaericus]|uniref:Transposase n=1 Tax=Streptomyces rhizosphaericus TaxID=114699 RepID=A0ABN1RHG1_9ACTN